MNRHRWLVQANPYCSMSCSLQVLIWKGIDESSHSPLHLCLQFRKESIASSLSALGVSCAFQICFIVNKGCTSTCARLLGSDFTVGRILTREIRQLISMPQLWNSTYYSISINTQFLSWFIQRCSGIDHWFSMFWGLCLDLGLSSKDRGNINLLALFYSTAVWVVKTWWSGFILSAYQSVLYL